MVLCMLSLLSVRRLSFRTFAPTVVCISHVRASDWQGSFQVVRTTVLCSDPSSNMPYHPIYLHTVVITSWPRKRYVFHGEKNFQSPSRSSIRPIPHSELSLLTPTRLGRARPIHSDFRDHHAHAFSSCAMYNLRAELQTRKRPT